MSEKIIKVVDINSPFQVILNVGSDDGIKNGDRVLIYGLGKEIKDPDSKEIIERLEVVRGKGKVIHTQTRISTVESIEVEETPTTIRKRSNSYSNLFFPGESEETEIRRTKLPFEEVQIGDLVRFFKK
ncbi:hypothetical protein JWG45_17245 [Leptospira sp. 201903070]|uniref:Uncharacterized protein n=1 Tax=Leptospira ainlahdjerensis TaxID=2810033 RepID=A0ABS2UES2_9LEPT|nr:hypothetical protein [Leptospira ainlahdjerensis]MBM9578894.1 hypothetical protein [Leptospira ainlahdjerensis]